MEVKGQKIVQNDKEFCLSQALAYEKHMHASSQNSEAVDVRKVARHPPSRRVVACDDYSFYNNIVFSLLQWKTQTIIKLKLKQVSKEC